MIADIVRSISAYGQAIRLVPQLRLWPFMLVPALLSMLLGVAIFFLAWGLSDDAGAWIMALYPWEWGRSVIEGIATVFSGLIIILTGLLLYKNLIIIITSPFLSPLSEKVEKHLRGADDTTPWSAMGIARDFFRGLRITLRNLLKEIFFTILLLTLGLIPVLAPFTTAAIFLVQSYYAGFGNIDFLLERHYRVRESVQFIRRNRGMAIGNGIVFIGLLLTGVGFLVAPTLGVIAGTISGCRRIEPKDTPHKYLNELKV